MYRIIGVDQKEYGPINAEQIRTWIAEGRANAQTQAQADDSNEWKPLAAFPAFATALAANAAPSAQPPLVELVDAEALAAEIMAQDYQLDIGDCLSRGWELTKQHFWLLVGATTLVCLAWMVADALPPGGIAGVLLFGPLFGGLDWLFLKKVRGQAARIEDAFAGFTTGFVHLALAGTVSLLLVGVGLALLILPGIYLLVSWTLFVPLLVIDKKLEFWPAMELSRRVVHLHWWKMLGFLVLTSLVALAGVLACGVGLFVTSAISTGAIVCAYEDIFGRKKTSDTPSV